MDGTDEQVALLAAHMVDALRQSGAKVEANPGSLAAVRIDGSCDFLLLARAALAQVNRKTDESITPDQLNAQNDE